MVSVIGTCFLLLPLSLQEGAHPVASLRDSATRRPVSTYSIVARDPATGQLGVAVQSHWFGVGSIVTWAEAGVGAVATQSFARASYGPELLADLRAGQSPTKALAVRLEADPGSAVRQVGVVDARGRVAVHTGSACIASAGHETGEQFSVQANIMRDDSVVPAMAAAYRDAEGSFAQRLLSALEGAQAAGGDLRGMQSAALLIVDGDRPAEAWEGQLVNLRVDDHPRPLEELRRLLRIHEAYVAANEGDVAMEENDADAALRAYARAESLYPEQVELSFWRAVGLLSKDRDAEAFPILSAVFTRDPAWIDMPRRLVAAGHLQADEARLARIEALAPRFDLNQRLAQVDEHRLEIDVRRLVDFGTRHTLSDTEDVQRGIGAARRWLRDEFQRISDRHHAGRLQVEISTHALERGRRIPAGTEVVNVVATLPGKDPDRLVVLSGHYDSRAYNVMDASSDAPGANDDASGTAVVLEAVRILAGIEPRATLVFMAVAGEEQGLLGARAQAEQWKEAGYEVEAMFTMDIVGGAIGSNELHEPWRMRVFSEGVPSKGRPVFGSDNDSRSRQLARYLAESTRKRVPGFEPTLIFRQDRYLRGGDHKAFNDLGWPAVRLTEPHENYDWQHRDLETRDGIVMGDRPENVDYAYVARITRAVTAAATELALAPAAPARVQVDTRGLSPHTRLLWERGQEPDLAGYAVRYRRTHEPVWTHRLEVGLVQEIEMKQLSKDDWLFAVEAIDRAGNRSLPVYPTPKFR